jgi:hypothetical protein
MQIPSWPPTDRPGLSHTVSLRHPGWGGTHGGLVELTTIFGRWPAIEMPVATIQLNDAPTVGAPDSASSLRRRRRSGKPVEGRTSCPMFFRSSRAKGMWRTGEIQLPTSDARTRSDSRLSLLSPSFGPPDQRGSSAIARPGRKQRSHGSSTRFSYVSH